MSGAVGDPGAGSVGLPAEVRACLFDLDGVLTRTAVVHAQAWKEMFDAFLRTRAERTGVRFVPFDAVSDYDEYVDGEPRLDGVRSFLASRGIELPEGGETDHAGAETVHGLAGRKNELLLELIERDGVEPYEGSVRYVHAVRDAGLGRAVVSSSENCRQMLEAAGIADLFEVRIDGLVAEREHLRGKPAPDTFLAGARALAVVPARGGGVRGRTRRGRGRTCGRVRCRRGSRPGWPGGGIAPARRRCRGRRPC